MTPSDTAPASIDACIAASPAAVRPVLRRIRSTTLEAAHRLGVARSA